MSRCARAWSVLATLAAALPLGGCGGDLTTAPVISQPGTTTTIILVRHAERDEGLDPPINAEGEVRADALADALEDNGVTAIFVPDQLRNRQTAEPLAERLGLEMNLIPAVRLLDTRTLADDFVTEVLADHAGGIVLWVGNTGPEVGEQSGNLQEIYARLGGTGSPPIRYQDLYIAVIDDQGGVHFIKTEYGGPSSLD